MKKIAREKVKCLFLTEFLDSLMISNKLDKFPVLL